MKTAYYAIKIKDIDRSVIFHGSFVTKPNLHKLFTRANLGKYNNLK